MYWDTISAIWPFRLLYYALFRHTVSMGPWKAVNSLPIILSVASFRSVLCHRQQMEQTNNEPNKHRWANRSMKKHSWAPMFWIQAVRYVLGRGPNRLGLLSWRKSQTRPAWSHSHTCTHTRTHVLMSWWVDVLMCWCLCVYVFMCWCVDVRMTVLMCRWLLVLSKTSIQG
jgi:hypothetical protein